MCVVFFYVSSHSNRLSIWNIHENRIQMGFKVKRITNYNAFDTGIHRNNVECLKFSNSPKISSLRQPKMSHVYDETSKFHINKDPHLSLFNRISYTFATKSEQIVLDTLH